MISFIAPILFRPERTATSVLGSLTAARLPSPPTHAMEIDEFVYNPHGHFNSSLMSLTKGTFTFIAGEVAHTGSMQVNTPVGTMGIRGTAPRVEILNDGSVKFSTLIEAK